MGKLVGCCVWGIFVAGAVVVRASEDPPPRVRQICDPAQPEMADVCVPDTLEVVFGTDKSSADSVFQYTTLPSDPIDVTIVMDTKSEEVWGWVYGVAHDMSYLTVLDATIDGTDAAAVWWNGFDATSIDVETCDGTICSNPTKGGGFISAVVLCLKTPVQLPPGQKNSVCKAKYKVEKDAGAAGTYLEFTDLLAAPHSPPTDLVTVVDGQSRKWTNVTDGWIKRASSEAKFLRGDANGDGKVDIADPIWLVSELVRQGPATQCRDAADANDDGRMDLSDAMHLIAWQFLHESAPPAPGPFACGADPTADALSCSPDSAHRCP